MHSAPCDGGDESEEAMIIAVDFDGTIVNHRYPDIGVGPGLMRMLEEVGK